MLVGETKSLGQLRLGDGAAPHLDHQRSMLVPRVEQVQPAPIFPAGGREGFRRRVYDQLPVHATFFGGGGEGCGGRVLTFCGSFFFVNIIAVIDRVFDRVIDRARRSRTRET